MSSTPLSATDSEGDAENRKSSVKITTPRQRAATKKVKVETTVEDEKPKRTDSAKVGLHDDLDSQ